MWFDSWSAVLRIVLVGAASYVALVVLLRLGGKRILAKLSAFDQSWQGYKELLRQLLKSARFAWF